MWKGCHYYPMDVLHVLITLRLFKSFKQLLETYYFLVIVMLLIYYYFLLLNMSIRSECLVHPNFFLHFQGVQSKRSWYVRFLLQCTVTLTCLFDRFFGLQAFDIQINSSSKFMLKTS
jgi:hypothetical protein